MNDKVEKVKQHFKENRERYILIGAGAGVAATGFVLGTRFSQVSASQNVIGISYKPVQNLNQITMLTRRGHPGFVVKCNETGEIFASLRRAADAMHVDPSDLRKHLKGTKDSVKGFTFQKLGEAA